MRRMLKHWLFDPSPAGLLVYITILALIAAMVLMFCLPAKADLPAETHGQQGPTSEAVAHVERIMLNFADGYSRHPVHRGDYRSEFSEWIVAAAERKNLEIEWVTAIVQRESSFNTSVRPGFHASEIGVMQVHPGTARTFMCEMKSVTGQLDCGCAVLRYGLDKCGTIAGALSVYQSKTGTCHPKQGSKLADDVESRLELIEKHKGM